MEVNFQGTDQANWHFLVRVPSGESPEVSIDWPGNPIQIAGRHPSLAIAPGQIVMFAMSARPCMFTEDNCMAMAELSAREDGNLAFSIIPSGSVRHENGARTIMHGAFVGTCQRRNGG